MSTGYLDILTKPYLGTQTITASGNPALVWTSCATTKAQWI